MIRRIVALPPETSGAFRAFRIVRKACSSTC